MGSTTHDATGDHRDPAEFWEERYRDGVQRGADRANPRLVEVVDGWEPGSVLDLGAGPGGDTVWLAGKGWRVTAVDISATAVDGLAARARDLGLADRIRTERHDLAHTFPAGEFDLVSAQYFHTPFELDRARVFRAAAHALRPGGHLLVVDHGDVAPWMSVDADHHFDTPDEVAAAMDLDPAGWSIVRADRPRREATGPTGEHAHVTDNVLLVRRADT